MSNKITYKEQVKAVMEEATDKVLRRLDPGNRAIRVIIDISSTELPTIEITMDDYTQTYQNWNGYYLKESTDEVDQTFL